MVNDVNRDIDAPLADLNLDLLGRDVYAQRVADMIGQWKSEHSAVFAIYGEWGSGKTTFKNFVLEKVKRLPKSDQPLVVEFNPWEWEGPKQVTEAFFARIVEEIGEKAPDGEEVSSRLSRYATYFTLGASIADSAATILPLLVPGVGPLATLVGKSLKEAGKQTYAGSEAKPKQQSLSELRRHVIESIKAMKKTLIVTIDDVDRLTTNETAVLFQILKSNADFPNIVYLILCDREVVARNLEKVVAERGDEYLEKIVQLGLPLPKAYPEQLRAILLDGITQTIRNAGVERFLDRDRMFSLYDHHAESYFRTMRDVKRFLATLTTLLPAVIHEGEPEVDLVDFIGMEFLRAFDPAFYESIYCYRSRITGREGSPSKDDEFMKSLAGNRLADDPALGIFRELFPRFGPRRSLLGTQRNVGHRQGFDRFFIIAVPPDQYTGAEENDVLARRGLDFELELETARSRGRLQYLLQLLAGATPPVDAKEAINYLAALGNFADSMRSDDGADDVDSYRAQIARLIFACLRPFTVDVRTHVLIAACERSNSVWFSVSFADHFESSEPAGILEEGISRLKDIAKTRLRSAGEQVESHPAAGELMLWWFRNGGTEEVMRHTEHMLESDKTFFDLLYAFSQVNLANIGKSRKRRTGFICSTRELGRVVPIEKVLQRLDVLDEDVLSWDQRELARTVRDDARRVADMDDDVAKEEKKSAPASEIGDDAK